MSGPIEQFDIKPIINLPKIGGLDVSFTNSSLFMLLGVIVSISFFLFAMRKKEIIPGKLQSVAEVIYEAIFGMVNEMVGSEGRKYFPLIFSLFLFVLMGNFLGLFPYTFTYTSHFSAVGSLSVLAVGTTAVIGIKKRGWGWFETFFPKRTPIAIAPILVPIEMISFFSKPISLTIRLSVNMIAGHVMLKVIAGFVYGLSYWGGWLPVLFVGFLTVFDLGIAILQAYIYTILMCVYLNDAIHSH